MIREGVAVVTGASSGLGRSFAEQLAAVGCDLVVAALPDTGLPELADEIAKRYQRRVTCVEADLTDRGQRERLRDVATAQGDSISLLVNCAGISGKGAFPSLPRELHLSAVELNIVTVTDLCHLFLPALQLAPGSAIINVASLGGFFPMPFMAVYAATKAYIIQFTLALREELASGDVHVYALCPGAMPTNDLTRRDLAAQGRLGRLTAHEADRVAFHAIRHVQRGGGGIVIYGWYNRLLRIVGTIPTRPFMARFMGRRYRRVYSRIGLI